MPQKINFRQLDAFRAVMLTGTTTAAASLLNTTQPSISRLLTQLKDATGVKLFDLHKSRLRPTREGRQLFETVQRHFLGLERIEQSAALMRSIGSGTLRIGSTPALGLSVLPKAIKAFSKQYPAVHVNLQTVGGHALREGLLHGVYDVVLTTAPLNHPQLDDVRLHRASAVCIMHPDHDLSGLQTVHVRDLKQQTLLTLNADDETQLQLNAELQRHGVQAATMIETTYSATICRMAAEGCGVGIVNPYIAAVFARDLHVVPLLPVCPIDVCMAFPGQSAVSTHTEQFARILRDFFRDIPGRGGRTTTGRRLTEY
jgi:DNA-binding transcriptional LysR family regulator